MSLRSTCPSWRSKSKHAIHTTTMAYALDITSDHAASREPNCIKTVKFAWDVLTDTAQRNEERNGTFALRDPLNGCHIGNIFVTALLTNSKVWDITYAYDYFEHQYLRGVLQHAEFLKGFHHGQKTIINNMKSFLKKASPELISTCSEYFEFEDNVHGNICSRKNINKIFTYVSAHKTAPTIVEKLPSCNPFGKYFGNWVDGEDDEHGTLVKQNPLTDQAINFLLMDDATLQKHIDRNSTPCKYRVSIMRFLATIWD